MEREFTGCQGVDKIYRESSYRIPRQSWRDEERRFLGKFKSPNLVFDGDFPAAYGGKEYPGVLIDDERFC